jgi:hypothetical protein
MLDCYTQAPINSALLKGQREMTDDERYKKQIVDNGYEWTHTPGGLIEVRMKGEWRTLKWLRFNSWAEASNFCNANPIMDCPCCGRRLKQDVQQEKAATGQSRIEAAKKRIADAGAMINHEWDGHACVMAGDCIGQITWPEGHAEDAVRCWLALAFFAEQHRMAPTTQTLSKPVSMMNIEELSEISYQRLHTIPHFFRDLGTARNQFSGADQLRAMARAFNALTDDDRIILS